MIIETNEVNIEKFTSEFKKRFENFCSRMPLFISPQYVPNKVILFTYSDIEGDERRKLFEYSFDYTKDVKINIYEIKKILQENYYPIIKQVKEEEIIYEVEELNNLIANGDISIDDVTPNGGIIKTIEITWRLEKILLEEDALLIRNLENNVLYITHLKMPVTTFLKKIISEINDPYERGFLLDRKVKDISIFYEVSVDIEGWIKNKIKKGLDRDTILNMYEDCLDFSKSKIDRIYYNKLVDKQFIRSQNANS